MGRCLPKTESAFIEDMTRFTQAGGVVSRIRRCLNDSDPTYDTDGQYNFMNRWALERIVRHATKHYDLASQVSFSTLLSALMDVEFLDIRDPGVCVERFKFRRGDITRLPYANDSLDSVSCLHVAEHIGLGRYGDEIDPDGFDKACQEIKRVLAPGGNLYFAVPCGIPAVEFNAHRVLAVNDVISRFGLKLVSFSAMNTAGRYIENAPLDFLDSDTYGVGMFHFTKESND